MGGEMYLLPSQIFDRSNDYGVAKKGGFLQHLAEGGDVQGSEFDAYDFLFNDEDDNKAKISKGIVVNKPLILVGKPN